MQFVHCPKVKSSDLENSLEYDSQILSKAFADLKFDSVIIDGPLAWRKDIMMSRVSNIKHFINHLEDKFIIFVDDVDRKGEKMLVENLKKRLNVEPQYIDPTFTIFSKGQNFNFGV